MTPHTILSRPLFFLISYFSIFSTGILAAAAPESGQPFPDLPEMQDQHEQAYALPSGVEHVAIAFTMSVGKSANQAFAAKGADYLPAADAVFIANIDGMPAVGRFFALPKMRKYPHRIMLADTPSFLDDFPQEEGRVTVFDLDAAGRIEAIRYWDPESGEMPF